ncbi:hypothetical protein [Endozoicomonas lisbonensis]|uniref:Uncharacterized protein n=1 Tax=Endozoicomonas lisbonensis TaxID=3120522 RepID=A0ABV2SB29_9GAMM
MAPAKMPGKARRNSRPASARVRKKTASACRHEKGDDAVENWVAERALKVLCGQSDRVARGIRQSASKRGLKKREAIDKCASYLINDRMDITGAGGADDCPLRHLLIDNTLSP